MDGWMDGWMDRSIDRPIDKYSQPTAAMTDGGYLTLAAMARGHVGCGLHFKCGVAW